MKNNDVYDFQWSEKMYKEIDNLNHCFDGQLIAKNGMLYDTYWSSNNKFNTFSEWKKKGTLKKKYNLNDMKEIKEHDCIYYNDSDIHTFHRQHGCRKMWLIKIGTKKSKVKIRKILKMKIDNNLHEIRRAKENIKHYENQLNELKSSNFTFEHFYVL